MEITKQDFIVGSSYNISYSEDSYLRGQKETILISQVEPEIKYVILYADDANMYCNDLRSNTITAGLKSFEKDQIREVFHDKDFIKKSEVVNIDDAINRGLIKVSQLKSMFENQSDCYMMVSPVITFDGGKRYIKFNVEGKDNTNQYLQSIFIKWNNQKEMEADIKRFVPDAWFI